VIDVAQNYTFGLPVAASSFAERLDSSLNILHVGMAAIFVLWGIFFTYCLVKFRARPGRAAEYHGWKSELGSWMPDAAVLAFEIWLIFIFGLPLWSHVKEEFPAAESSHVVEMVAEQFAWGFHYAGPDGQFARKDPKQVTMSNPLGLDETDPAGKDDYITYNELHVPLGKPTLLYMTSKDVIHSFFVPEFRVKQDVVPGMRSPLWFEPIKAGRFEIGCAQLCGTGHYAMRGEVAVYSPEEYDAWAARMSGAKQAAAAAAEPAEDWAE
jgi:cytochrome c oxidase subunit II